MSGQLPNFRLPVLQAIVLCDCVYTDARTGKKVIAGTFNTLWGHEFPTVFSRPTYVYLCLTEVHAQTTVQLRYVDLDKNDVLLGLDGLEISANSPLEAVELAVEVPPLPMPHAGVFAFEVHCLGSIVGTVRIHVQQLFDKADKNGHT
jgi:hypothetical protein